MSLYNQLFGTNKLSPGLLKILEIDQPREDKPELPKTADSWDANWDSHSSELENWVKECIDKKIYTSGRFRDIYLNEDGTKIILYTRNGGGNREEYWYIFKGLKTHPNYLEDYDDDYDSTYAYIEFLVPEKYRELAKALATGEAPKSVSNKFSEIEKEIKDMTPDELRQDKRFEPLVQILEEINDKARQDKTDKKVV